jgi:hypothetical protein
MFIPAKTVRHLRWEQKWLAKLGGTGCKEIALAIARDEAALADRLGLIARQQPGRRLKNCLPKPAASRWRAFFFTVSVFRASSRSPNSLQVLQSKAYRRLCQRSGDRAKKQCPQFFGSRDALAEQSHHKAGDLVPLIAGRVDAIFLAIRLNDGG